MERAAQIVLALILLANLAAYLRGGAPAVRAWWHAKIVGTA